MADAARGVLLTGSALFTAPTPLAVPLAKSDSVASPIPFVRRACWLSGILWFRRLSGTRCF